MVLRHSIIYLFVYAMIFLYLLNIILEQQTILNIQHEKMDQLTKEIDMGICKEFIDAQASRKINQYYKLRPEYATPHCSEESLFNRFHFHTFIFNDRTPQQVIGTHSFIYQDRIDIGKYRVMKVKYEDAERERKIDILSTIHFINQIYENKEIIGFFLKEDNFVTCLSIDEIIQVIINFNLEKNIVNLGYDFGLIYIPASLIDSVLYNARGCFGSIEKCLSEQISYSRVRPPVAVKKIGSKELNSTKSCNWKCFVDCMDANIENEYQVSVDISSFFEAKGIKIQKTNGYCNKENTKEIEKIGCYEKSK